MQRSLVLKIIRPYDEKISWENLGYLLRGLSYNVCRMSNYCMTHHLLRSLNLETENLNPQGHLYCYPRLTEEYPDVPAGIICAAEGRARKLYMRNAAGVLRSEKALPSFRKDSSIPIPVAGYSIGRVDADNYVANVQLLSRQGAKAQKMPGRIQLVLASNWRDKNAGRALQQLAEGKLKRGIASIFRNKRDWYISIPSEAETAREKEEFDPELVMGVAFGMQCALAYAFNHSLKRGAIGGEEVLAHQEKYQARKKHIRAQYNWSGRKGHGRGSALKPLQSLYEKERNYRNLTNERYAKWVVEIARKNRCGKIQLDAGSTGQSEGGNILLARWPQSTLRLKIRNKAEAYGIAVQECPDRDIRNRCSRCGATQDAPEDKRWFTCKSCGYGIEDKKTGAQFISMDYNAARNLAKWEEAPKGQTAGKSSV